MLVTINEEENPFKGADPEELTRRRKDLISYDDIAKLEEDILEIARDEADQIYKDLEKQYDYIMSDEGIRADIENNDPMFDVDPETGLLNEAKNPFKGADKKELEAREAKAKADRIKSGSVYFNDLTPEDQETVIQRYKDDSDYPGYDWWEGDIGDRWRDKDGNEHKSKGYYDEELEKKGFLYTEIHFSGFYSQGDGASFECTLDVAKIVKHYKLTYKPIMQSEIEEGMFNGKIETSGHYSHSNTMNINIEYEGDMNESRVNEDDEDTPFKGPDPEELASRKFGGYTSLNDVFPAGDTEIWYFKSTGTDTEYGQEADLMMGYEWCKKKGCLPDPNNLEKTHVLLGKIALTDRDEIFADLQGDEWSPEGEARPLISGKGLHHTSMSVGDIMKIGDKVIFVDAWGFAELNESLKEAGENPFKGASQEELEARPGYREAQRQRERDAEDYEARRRRIEQRHLTQPDSRSLIDQWVSGTRNRGRAASLSVKGNALFSYATPIAVRYNGVIYMVDQKFSRTTSKQQSYVRQAAGDTVTAVPVPEFKRMLDAEHIDYGYSWLREHMNEAEGENPFKGATPEELEARGTLKYLPKTGPVDYKFLRHVEYADTDDRHWEFVGMGDYLNYDLSDVYFYKHDDPEFSILYNTEDTIRDNMDLSDELTQEIQAFTGTDEEWVKSKGWEIDYSGTTQNEDHTYFWADKDFSYVAFTAPDENILGGAVISFGAQEPKVYLGDLNDVFGALHSSEPQQDIADMFGYDHYENLVYDMKKYRGELTADDEKEGRPAEHVPGQMVWNFNPHAVSKTYTESKVNEDEENPFKGADPKELKQRRADANRIERERKAKRSAETRAYYAAIPYTYEDIIKLTEYKAIVKLPGVEDITSNLQKSRRTLTFQLAYTVAQHGAVRTVDYYVYPNGYLRAQSYGEQRVIKKFFPATTLQAYATLLIIMGRALTRKIAKEKRRPPFDTSYECEVCGTPGSLFHNAYIRWSYLPRHNYGTRLGNLHLKDPRNAAELARLQAKAVANGSEIKL